MSKNSITTKEATDALLKLCSAKDGLYPYVGHLYNEGINDGGVAQGLETALVISPPVSLGNDITTTRKPKHGWVILPYMPCSNLGCYLLFCQGLTLESLLH